MQLLDAKALWALVVLTGVAFADDEDPPETLDALDSMYPVGDLGNCWKIEMFEPETNTNGLNYLLDGRDNSICRMPRSNDCLFYSRGLSSFAKEYAEDTGQITIWDIWQSQYYDFENVETNQLRCIMFKRVDRLQYFMWMSLAMAALCDTYAQYITPNPEMPDLAGFFGKFELNQMILGGKDGRLVNAVDAISQGGAAGPGSDIHNIFTRNAQRKMLRARTDWAFGSEAEGAFNATLFDEVVRRASLLPRAGCGATAQQAAILDQCGIIPW